MFYFLRQAACQGKVTTLDPPLLRWDIEFYFHSAADDRHTNQIARLSHAGLPDDTDAARLELETLQERFRHAPGKSPASLGSVRCLVKHVRSKGDSAEYMSGTIQKDCWGRCCTCRSGAAGIRYR